jgi:SpoVK/Ycf46/Vps4 family AAA+-type ATPase
LLKAIKKVKVQLSDHEFWKLVKHTEGYSCSDITELCKDAAMGPIRDVVGPFSDVIYKNLDKFPKIPEADLPPVAYIHFVRALHNVRQSSSPVSLNLYKQWGSRYGSNVAVSD